MFCISPDDTNFLPAGEKIVGHDMAGMTACSQYYVHKRTSYRFDAGGSASDSALEPPFRARNLADKKRPAPRTLPFRRASEARQEGSAFAPASYSSRTKNIANPLLDVYPP